MSAKALLVAISALPTTQCVIWTGGASNNGYGALCDGSAHRRIYECLVGPIPHDMHLDHLCRVRMCVNPAHLEIVTPAENNRRGESVSAMNARKKFCIHGHPFNEENTILVNGRKGRRRECRACQRASSERRQAARPIQECQHCGTEFKATRINQRFCGVKCAGIVNAAVRAASRVSS